jgi:SHS2 domain-containing protein
VYRWVEHTGELELEIEAGSERAVFEEAFEAMRELLKGESELTAGGATVTREVAITGSDRPVLLTDWLAELAYLAESEGLVPRRLVELGLTEAGLEAVIEGKEGEPPHLVKGATLHRLGLERSASGWRATVVLDV